MLNDVEVNIDGVKIVVKFEVIEILEDVYPYLEMFGIDWAFGNNFILNLNEWYMTFELEELHVVSPLDATEGEQYIELI